MSARSRRTTSSPHPTRILLTCAALAAVGVVLTTPLVPLLGALAPASPPGYALSAGIYSLMPFLARLYTGINGTTTLTAFMAGVFFASISSVGVLILVPLVVSGLTFDGSLWLLQRRPRAAAVPRLAWVSLSAAAAGIALFVVSLPVFSIEHLVPAVLVATLVGRVLGEVGAALLAVAIVGRLRRAGLRSPSDR